MKKVFLLLITITITMSVIFASCSTDKNNNNQENENTTTSESILDSDEESGFETDKDGNQIPVIYEKDKKGKTIAIKVNESGEKVTKKNGEYVTVPTDYEITTTMKSDSVGNTDNLTTTKKDSTTKADIKDKIPMTSVADTTKAQGDGSVPKTSDTGKKVNFSVKDQNAIKSMLEVPYLYLESYEATDNVPISIACHVAVWITEHDGNIKKTYSSEEISYNLFKYFSRTVVNFNSQCNSVDKSVNSKIRYNSQNKTYTISEFTPKKQDVTIIGIEDLGGDNYYKITGMVSGCSKRKVVAIIQKNKFDSTLGFSILALKWS